MFAHMESLSNATTSMINGVDIHHESMGDDSSPCVLICNGLAMTMSYTGGFAERFVDMGFRVIRYDSRDTGLSYKSDAEWPNPPEINPTNVVVPDFCAYDMETLAADALGVLDHYGVSKAHIYGFSLGTVVSQILAVKHPERCLSLVLHMGFVDLTECWAYIAKEHGGKFFMHAMAMKKKYPTSKEQDYETWLTNATEFFCAVIGADAAYPTTLPLLKGLVRKWHEDDYERGAVDWSGNANKRHTVAMVCWARKDGKLAKHMEALKTLSVPTLCLHGRHDPLTPIEKGGRLLASTIPKARLVEFQGGHNFGNHKSVYELVAAAAVEHMHFYSEARADGSGVPLN